MYDSEIDGRMLTFANSGWLYQSSVVPYDRETKSLWTQVDGTAIGGKLLGRRLTKLPSRDTTWGAWRAEHPETLLLSTDTGFKRMYGANPYTVADASDPDARPPFPVTYRDARLPPRAFVYGIELGGAAKAYPATQLASAPEQFADSVGGRRLRITNAPPGETFAAYADDGAEIPAQRMFWFAWAAHHQRTQVFEATEVALVDPTPPAATAASTYVATAVMDAE